MGNWELDKLSHCEKKLLSQNVRVIGPLTILSSLNKHHLFTIVRYSSLQMSYHGILSLHNYTHLCCWLGFASGSDSKGSACNAGDLGSIPGQEDPLEKGMATHSSICLGNSRDRGTWPTTLNRVGKELDKTEWLTLACCIVILPIRKLPQASYLIHQGQIKWKTQS